MKGKITLNSECTGSAHLIDTLKDTSTRQLGFENLKQLIETSNFLFN